MNERSHDIDVLNDLIAATLDSSDGYSEAADHAKNPMIADLFRQWAAERRRVVAELRVAVRDLGGEPEDDGTVLASVHRMFLDLRSHMSHGDRAVIDEVERGEDHIKDKFERALAEESLGPRARDAVQAAYAPVRAGHDEMRALKHSHEKG
ncbi:PA2169 family four-helix-bundle protein [Dyella jiangningensis]|uniref:DUF2383 domain-containing protein n=1 Tax=Dyella jiangningensis TaxID=1379159 RepID=A0A328P4D4_9GAMM|nr:PA2169 family four-helix-bundle protein [Dyella jiangningensis]RAO76171.1 hypothetical protein CA260_10750 [Dyella jiangningensis]